MKSFAVLALLSLGSIARADPPVASSQEPSRTPPPEEPQAVPPAHALDAADTAGAPLPGEESGRLDAVPHDSNGRRAARAALFLPKVILAIATAPFDVALYLNGKYQFEDLYYRTTHFRNRTIAIVPTATWETGFGFTAGLRFYDLDTFGDHEKLVLQGTIGGSFRTGALVSLDSGRRLGRFRLELGGNFDQRPTEPFYGIGNEGDLSPPVRGQRNAYTDDTAIHSYFRYQEARINGLVDIAVRRHFFVSVRGALTQLRYSHDTHIFPSIDQIWDPATLTGFGTSTNRLYGEAELRWDDRTPITLWEPSTVHARGTFAALYGGYSAALDDGDKNFFHYGLELQHYFRIGYGPRVIILRYHGEVVTGTLDQVPITELPMLGGGWFLRGYDYARFRDRIAMVGTLQYMWSLTANSSAFIFTDVGRVWRNWDAFTLDDLHVGFGIGLEIYMPPSFLADVTLGSSSDGGVVVNAEFAPVLDGRQRWR